MKTPEQIVNRLIEDDADFSDEIEQIEAVPYDPATTTITLGSSHGEIIFDGYGNVVEDNLTYGPGEDDMNPEYAPVRLDIEEFRRTYPTFPLDGHHDILDWGFWMANGEYGEPEEDWRRDMHLREIRAAAYPEYGKLDREAMNRVQDRLYADGQL